MSKPTFDLVAGLLVQTEALSRWNQLLQPHVMNAVLREAMSQNAQLNANSDGYAVWRGQSIDEFIQNYRP